MARLFIFAVGGTGARVLRSLTMLMAAGVRIPNCEQVIPILVDPDTQNGDVTRTVSLLKGYTRLHQTLHAGGRSTSKGFFGQPLATLAQLNTAGAEGLRESFVYDFGGINKSFQEYMQFNSAPPATKGLLNLLFTPDSLAANLDVGFRGSPNVGSVVLNSLMQSKEMRYLAQSLNADDRVFFISSIFGGTGAAGFPLLVKNLRDTSSSLPQPQIRAQIAAGALVLLPYFKLQQPSAEEKAEGREFIDSNSFITKTKTALSYYADNLKGLEAVYYLGDQAGQPLPNNPGRAAQRNQAHLLEMLGALAIPHFMEQPKEQLDRNDPAYHEYGLKSDQPEVDFSQLTPRLRKEVARPLIQFHYFARYYRYELGKDTSAPFYAAGLLKNHLPASSGPLSDLDEFFAEYSEWLQELGENERRFIGLRPAENDFNKMVADKAYKPSAFKVWDKGISTALSGGLDRAVGKTTLKNPDAPEVLRWIVEAFEQATDSVLTQKLQYQ